MKDAFFLLILPTRTLTIHLGSYRQCRGLSLRGDCSSAADATHLLQTVRQLLESRPAQAWIDSQQLHALSHLGQQALLQADSYGRQRGTALYWCGMPHLLARQLETGGVAQRLNLRPAASFEGPNFLLPTGRAKALPAALPG